MRMLLLPPLPPLRSLPSAGAATLQSTSSYSGGGGGSFAATTTSAGGGGSGSRLGDLSGLLFNTLIIVAMVLAVSLLVFCLCSWCKLLACRLCCGGGDNDSDDDDREEGGSGRRRGARRRQWRCRVSPASQPPLQTVSGGRFVDVGGRLYPAPPPSYFESVDQLGMPPTPPPGYSTAAAAAAAAEEAADAAAAVAEAAKSDSDGATTTATTVAAVGGSSHEHRSCPNICLVAQAPTPNARV